MLSHLWVSSVSKGRVKKKNESMDFVQTGGWGSPPSPYFWILNFWFFSYMIKMAISSLVLFRDCSSIMSLKFGTFGTPPPLPHVVQCHYFDDTPPPLRWRNLRVLKFLSTPKIHFMVLKLVWYNTNKFKKKSKNESILLIGGVGVTGGLDKVHTFVFFFFEPFPYHNKTK